jgi:2-polyprenyl-6-methoxyphenol hydroxylase-like FAD-dependent oxidoreductase
MSSLRPIEIVGGGLAGLSLGLALRRENVPVVLHEAGRYPRHRVCGEFITGLDAGTIARLGLQPFLADALQHREVEWFLGDQSVRTQRLPQPALGLSRYALDARLAEAFVAAGGDLRTSSRLADPTPQPGRILATGRRRSSRSPWMGLKLHAIALPVRRSLELHLGENAYVGLSRVEGDRVNVCGLFRRRELAAKNGEILLAYLRACGLSDLAARLGQVARDPDSFSAVAGVAFDPRVSSDAPATLGDACAMIPPFTGNGMAMAFQGAELALAPLLGYARGELSWDAACTRLQRDLRRNFRVRLASAELLHPFLLQPPRQRWLSALTRSRLLPLRPLYTLLH